MIESIEFHNFKVLRDCTLPLGRCNILVGPNGSGKSTVLQGLEFACMRRGGNYSDLASAAVSSADNAEIEVRLNFAGPPSGMGSSRSLHPSRTETRKIHGQLDGRSRELVERFLAQIRVYWLDAGRIAAPVQLSRNPELQRDGLGLAAVLDWLRDHHVARFDAVNQCLTKWLPEFDALSFDVDPAGNRLFFLRTRGGNHEIPAASLSQGTLLALTMLTLAYLPEPPPLVGLEEPDRGIHPRLLRHVKDALYRLAYPENYGENRAPVQVIATTHSPYFLDLFKDHPEEIIIANRADDNVRFERLSDRPDIDEILSGAPLGEVWYTGILGGVPAES